jgi:SAM-dependent methyltransferase
MKHAPSQTVIERPELELGRHAFGADPAAYDAARRDYPPELFERIIWRIGPLDRYRAFEIGPGTGKATGPMLGLGLGSITAVEPDPRLAAWLRQNLPDPRLTLVEAPFEQADLDGHAFDLGYAATAFHWLDAPTALARVRRLLRPGGHWAMWWNVYQDPERADPFRDRITLDDRALPLDNACRYLVLSKPYGVLCAFTDPEGRPTLADFVDVPDVYAAGRLDLDSEGLLLLTSDGWLIHRLGHPRYQHPKTYLAQVERIPGAEALHALRRGVIIQGRQTAPAHAELMPGEPTRPRPAANRWGHSTEFP